MLPVITIIPRRNGVLHRRTVEGDEGHDVDGADARMGSAVGAQVDRVDADACDGARRALDIVAGQREYGPVVPALVVQVEQAAAADLAEAVENCLVASLAHVDHALKHHP